MRPYLEKTLLKKGLVEWLKAKALSSNPNTTQKKLTKYLDDINDNVVEEVLIWGRDQGKFILDPWSHFPHSAALEQMGLGASQETQDPRLVMGSGLGGGGDCAGQRFKAQQLSLWTG
jgi:hypothetical protein